MGGCEIHRSLGLIRNSCNTTHVPTPHFYPPRSPAHQPIPSSPANPTNQQKQFYYNPGTVTVWRGRARRFFGPPSLPTINLILNMQVPRPPSPPAPDPSPPSYPPPISPVPAGPTHPCLHTRWLGGSWIDVVLLFSGGSRGGWVRGWRGERVAFALSHIYIYI